MQCARRCTRRDACVAFQHSDHSCLLLSEAPGQNQLTADAGTRIFVRRCLIECTKVGNACYFLSTFNWASVTWHEDSEYCRSQCGPAGTLSTFYTEEQYNFLINSISYSFWLNIGYKDGSYKALDGSTSTWTQKWRAGEPQEHDAGFVFYYFNFKRLNAATTTDFKFQRKDVVCMVPSQIAV